MDLYMRELIEEYIKDIQELKDGNGNGNGNSNSNGGDTVKPLVKVLLELQQSQPDYYKDDVIFSILLVQYSILRFHFFRFFNLLRTL